MSTRVGTSAYQQQREPAIPAYRTQLYRNPVLLGFIKGIRENFANIVYMSMHELITLFKSFRTTGILNKDALLSILLRNSCPSCLIGGVKKNGFDCSIPSFKRVIESLIKFVNLKAHS